MNHIETIKRYLHCLEIADYENLILLFSKEAVVHSPLYGKVGASKFYKDVFQDSSESKIIPMNIFTAEDNQYAAAHFQYYWVLSDGTPAPFEVVDVFKFSPDGKILEVKIIYDSAKTRPAFENLNS